MNYGFKDFIPMYRSGEILESPTWRAYDIERMATTRKAKDALKTLGYRELNMFGFDQCARDYGLAHATEAIQVLGLWYCWSRLALGETKYRILRTTTGASNVA